MKQELAERAANVFATVACVTIMGTSFLGILTLLASVVLTFSGHNRR